MKKLALLFGMTFIGGAATMMVIQDRRINKIHKMYADMIAEHTRETYLDGFKDGKVFGAQQYRREAVFHSLQN